MLKISRILFPALALVLVMVLVSSCSGTDKYRVETSQIDSLLIQLDSAEKVFLMLDSASCTEKLKNVNTLLGEATNVIRDTLLKEEARLLSDFRSIKKPLKEFLTRRSSVIKEILVTRKQLKDLSHDLDEGLMSEVDVQKHFQQECDLAGMLIMSLKITSSAVESQCNLYDSLNLKLRDFVERKGLEPLSNK